VVPASRRQPYGKNHRRRGCPALDRYHLFQAVANKPIHLLGVPLVKSIQVLQDELAQMAEKGTLPEDSRRIYQMWIRILEGHYMTLFQSPEYSGAMSKTITAMNAFLTARQQAMKPLLKAIPVPTQKGLEDVTAFVLTQIVPDQAKNRHLLLPVPVLQLIIRYGDNALGEFPDRYLQPIVQTYLAHRQAFDRNFQQWIEMGSDFTRMAQQAAGMPPFTGLFGAPSGSGRSPKEEK
jgi:hypothetical protein